MYSVYCNMVSAPCIYAGGLSLGETPFHLKYWTTCFGTSAKTARAKASLEDWSREDKRRRRRRDKQVCRKTLLHEMSHVIGANGVMYVSQHTTAHPFELPVRYKLNYVSDSFFTIVSQSVKVEIFRNKENVFTATDSSTGKKVSLHKHIHS